MNCHKLLITAALMACSYNAFAQWQWVDESGRTVFSDRQPPANIPPHNILKTPAGSQPIDPRKDVVYSTDNLTASADAQNSASADTAEAPTAASDEQKQAASDEVKRKATEEAQRKAQEAEEQIKNARLAQQRKENCQQAHSVAATLNSGRILASSNEKGERGFMSEQQRQAQLQRAQAIIKKDC